MSNLTENPRSDGRFDRPEDDYAPMLAYANGQRQVAYADFDSVNNRPMGLFSFRENFDFDGLEEALDRITQTLPSIKRIFFAPITRLTDIDEILPAESVRVVNNRTLAHTAIHTELWGDFTRLGLKPRSLMTLTHEDDYAIYENRVFARAVDMIRLLVERNARILREMLYNSRVLEFNLLDRLDHLQYFLAIGKLHMDYVRDFEKSRERAERLLNKTAYIDRVIRSGMKSPVYRICSRQGGEVGLKKTNIFWKHKDYGRVYRLMKYFSARQIPAKPEDGDGPGEGYFVYCAMLSLFAARHFGFDFDCRQQLDFSRLRVNCAFREWRLTVEREKEALVFTFWKEKVYKILLLPITGGNRQKDALLRCREQTAADEYLSADSASYGEGSLYLSRYDLESFRRVQQILLRGMICSDRKFDVCPFCGQTLYELPDTVQNSGIVYGCRFCGTEILHLSCKNTGRSYPATRIGGYPLSESGKHYRNITPIGQNGEILCPYCGESHLP